MRFLWLLLLTLALAAPAAYAQSAPYVDPALRALIRPSAQAALRSNNSSPDIAIRRTNVFDMPRVGLFAKIRAEAAIAELLAAGALIGSRVGDLVTAEVPIDKLPAILASPRFEMFEASHNVTVQNDSSMKLIRANLVRRAAGGTWTGTAGRGIIVGVYDTGIDFLHEDFLDPAGATRVLGIWDQTARTGTPPAGFTYGNYCSREAIQLVVNNSANSGPCPQQDVNGHGSHVAGTAAGDGSALGPGGGAPFTYAGVAPLADLMIVKGGDGLFSETGIVDGLVWLERQGRLLNRPMVVNLSLGTQAGPHDGSRLYEAIVDTLSRGGFIVVFSAGNEGSNSNERNPDGTAPARNPLYIHGTGAAGATRDFTIDVPPYTPEPGKCNDFVAISLWYEAQDRLDISILRPDGITVTAPALTLRETDSPVGNVYIDNGSTGPNIRNNAYEADIRLNDCGAGAAPVAGLWTLHVTPTRSFSGKPFHFWMYNQSLGGSILARGRNGFDNHYVVSSPGNARSAITVGAYASKMCWTSPAKPEGPVCFVLQEAIGDLARFSSGGPARDGRQKPEITAPGLAIASVRSRFSSPAANRILAGGAHAINQGTSMAAPAVTGAIALMLQNRPTLTAAEVRAIFAQASDHDQFTARVYDTSADAAARFWWGYGKLNVCASLGAIATAATGAPGPVAITPAADTVPVNATTRFFSCSPTGAAVAFTSTNPAVATVDGNGIVHALQVGTTLIIATSGMFADTARLVVTNPATLSITLRNAAPATAVSAPRGTQIPLLATVLRANGYESIRVTQLSYRLTGTDPGARVILVADANRNGMIDFNERVIASKSVPLSGPPVVVDLMIDSLTVPQRDSVNLILAIQLSGAAPNQSVFTAEFLPGSTRSVGTRSLAPNPIDAVTSPLVSAPVTTTVLAEGESFTLSENPVRSGRVIFNFTAAPRAAAIYTLTGRMVTDLKKRLATNGSVIWDLTNDDGVRVAAGVYVVVFDMAGRLVREKLFVMSAAR